VKVTTEKLPHSLMALDIELDKSQVERGLDRAARRLSQKYTVPGFRKGKAPRFIIENYFGRDALIEEASEDLINKSFREALDQANIVPVGPADLVGIESADPFRFRVMVPVEPSAALPDYRAIREDLMIEPVTDEMLSRSMEALRDKHVVLQELDELRPARQGDQLTVQLESLVEDEPLEERPEDSEIPESTLVLEPDRLVDELYQGLLGADVGEDYEIVAQMPDDHANEQVRGKQVTFKVHVVSIQERLLPDWQELPTLEEFEGDFEALREQTRNDLAESARLAAERQVLDTYIEKLLAQTEFDIPEVLIREQAEMMLRQQGQQFERYGITLEQMLQYRGKTHDEAVEELMPDAKRQVQTSLAIQQVVAAEGIDAGDDEIDAEIQTMLNDYPVEQHIGVEQVLSGQLRPTVASAVIDRKLRERLIEIATGNAPALATGSATPEPAETAATDATPAGVETGTTAADAGAVGREAETAGDDAQSVAGAKE
jgi:trigger factor